MLGIVENSQKKPAGMAKVAFGVCTDPKGVIRIDPKWSRGERARLQPLADLLTDASGFLSREQLAWYAQVPNGINMAQQAADDRLRRRWLSKRPGAQGSRN